MDKINGNKSTQQESKVKTSLDNLKNTKDNSHTNMFDKGDIVWYQDTKYINELVFKNIQFPLAVDYKLRESGSSNLQDNVYLEPSKSIKSEPYLYVPQYKIIQDMLESRIDLNVIADVETKNTYILDSNVKLQGNSKREYELKERRLQQEMGKFIDGSPDYSIGFSYQPEGYDFWEKQKFENTIKIVLTIHNHKLNLGDLTGDLRMARNSVEMNDVYDFSRCSVDTKFFAEQEITANDMNDITHPAYNTFNDFSKVDYDLQKSAEKYKDVPDAF